MTARPLFACLALFLSASGGPALADAGTAATMRSAAQAMLASVDTGKRAKLALPFDDAKRTDWHYTPRSRPGLSFATSTRRSANRSTGCCAPRSRPPGIAR